MDRDFYKVLIVAASGKGKTFSSRNLDPVTTGFINVENKPLPFKNNFKNHKRCNTYQEAYAAIIEYGKNPEIVSIFFDSFSAYADLLLAECRNLKKGFDVWNMYNEEVGKLLTLIKKVPKEMFVTAHYEILNIEGDPEKRVKSKGKEWEGVIEKEFTIVLYADRKLDENKNTIAWFDTCLAGTSCKCPPDIIKDLRIDNDCNLVLQSIQNFIK